LDEKLIEQMSRAFTLTVRHCMEQEGVNLDAAVIMTRKVMEEDEKIDPTPPEIQRLMAEAFDRGEDKLRRAIDVARELVKLADEGSPEVKPYDPEKHMRARVEAIEDLRARGIL
jgi:hypothetical protein